MKRPLFLCATTLVLLLALRGGKLLLDHINFEQRSYVGYDLYPSPSTGEAILRVYKNDSMYGDAGRLPFIARRTAQGKLIPLIDQPYEGVFLYSKDGAVVAFRGTMLSNSQCHEGNSLTYGFAYDFSTRHEIGSLVPTEHLSKRIEDLIQRHGGATEREVEGRIPIGVEDQEKVQKVDVNLAFTGCDY